LKSFLYGYNHENKNSKIKCCKCKDKICFLTGKNYHLCGGKHNCKEKCEKDGWYDIMSYIETEEKIYTSKYGDSIKYKSIKAQGMVKKDCTIKIEENKCDHSEKHKCDVNAHKCGYKCPQCEYHCIEEVGHKGLHFCHHGNIKNSYISISDKGKVAIVKMENSKYNFEEGETAIIFFCDAYCKEQGQGHIHQFISNKKIEKNENVRLIDPRSNIYECKCSYYWENILKFKADFTPTQQKQFSLSNWKCKYTSHQTPEYCQLHLWHDTIDEIPNGVYGNWIYKGHVFKCIHPIAIYSLLLIDKSKSMESNSSIPTNDKNKQKLNNMLGTAIQTIDYFCKLRKEKSVNDKCAIIGFNNSAQLILKDTYVNDNENIINTCISNLKPEGGTKFYKAIKESGNILKEIKRNEYIPIIILLTDGLDHSYDKTKSYVIKVRK